MTLDGDEQRVGDELDEEPVDIARPRTTDPREMPMRFSALKLIKCPAKCRHALLTGYDETLVKKLGSATHAATLEPERVVVFRPGEFTDGKGKTKAHKGKRNGEAWEQFRAAQRPDAIILTPGQYEIAMRVADSLRSHPDAGPFLFGPRVIRERQILWSHDGRVCSSTPDARIPGVMIADLKTTKSADPERFAWEIVRSLYREQLRMYEEADAYDVGEDFATRRSIDLFVIAVETVRPNVVQVFEMHASAKRAADRNLALWWSRLRGCESTNHWPGYTQGIAPITDDEPENNLPGDELDDDEERIEL